MIIVLLRRVCCEWPNSRAPPVLSAASSRLTALTDTNQQLPLSSSSVLLSTRPCQLSLKSDRQTIRPHVLGTPAAAQSAGRSSWHCLAMYPGKYGSAPLVFRSLAVDALAFRRRALGTATEKRAGRCWKPARVEVTVTIGGAVE
jgi:hypothetical protein